MQHAELCVQCYADPVTARQRHSNAMLKMRRLMGPIVQILRIADPETELTDDECMGFLQQAGIDEMQVARSLSELLKKIGAK